MNQDQKHRVMLNTDFRVDSGCWGVSLDTTLDVCFINCPQWKFDQHFLLIVQYANQVFPTEKPMFTCCACTEGCDHAFPIRFTLLVLTHIGDSTVYLLLDTAYAVLKPYADV